MRQALLIPLLVMGWLAASVQPSWGQQHQCGTIGRASATSGEDKEHLAEAMEAFNQDREKVCQNLCKKRECDKQPCRAVGDDADATCSLGAKGWKCSDPDYNCKCTCDPKKDKGCPDREVAVSDRDERDCKEMARLACEAACKKGKCSPAGKVKVECESEQVEVVCKEHKTPTTWYDEKVLCDCDCPLGPDKED